MHNLDCLLIASRTEARKRDRIQLSLPGVLLLGKVPSTLKHSLYPIFPSQNFLKSSVKAGNPLEISKNMGVVESNGRLLPS